MRSPTQALDKIVRNNPDSGFHIVGDHPDWEEAIVAAGGEVVARPHAHTVWVAESGDVPAGASQSVEVRRRRNGIFPMLEDLAFGRQVDREAGVVCHTRGLRRSWGALYTMLGLVFLLALSSPFVLADSLVLDTVGHLYDYDYANLFIERGNFAGRTYLIFDWLVGWVHQALSGVDPLFPAQMVRSLILAFLLGGVALVWTGKDDTVAILLATLVLWGAGERAMLGRPCTVAMGCMFWAMAMEVRNRRWAGWLFTVGGSFIYWMGGLYAAPMMLFSPTYALAGAAGMLAHWAVMGDVFTEAIGWVASVQGGGSAVPNVELQISELVSLWQVVSVYNWALFAANLYVIAKQRHEGASWKSLIRRHRFFLAACYFAAPLMGRYIEVISPLLILNLRHELGGWFRYAICPYGLRYAAALALALFYFEGNLNPKAPLGRPRLPPPEIAQLLGGERVFAAEGVFSTGLMLGVPQIQLGPVLDPRASNEASQVLFRDLYLENSLDCSVLEQLSYDWVVESSFVRAGDQPSCLEWAGSYEGGTVWRVKRTENAQK